MTAALRVTIARPEAAAARRIVVKLGTSVVLRGDGAPAADRIASVVASIARLRAAGREVLVVSSGAVGLGARRLRLTDVAQGARPACAAVGQGELMTVWRAALARHRLVPAQVLVTSEDLADDARAERLTGTLGALLACGAVPVLNENDVVSASDHGATAFRDNDMLGALVSVRVGAALLVLLSDVDGVYTDDPTRSPDAARLATVHDVTPALLDRARGAGVRGRGGMAAKLAAAAHAAAAGVPTVIASGLAPDALDRAAAGDASGTLFAARAVR